MDRTVALVVAAAIGGVLAAQAPLNSALGRTVGGAQAVGRRARDLVRGAARAVRGDRRAVGDREA
jgi:hypothetical protein